ncbi:MAG: CDGSH iron-sulfur domain-containing protein [Gammaproteobacteria bacterium]|nr:CDGSH iron-sulfur domain-containing protein [Gammaproteobacteria bacterium]
MANQQQDAPMPRVLMAKAGEQYALCHCGKSTTQPLCDRSGSPCQVGDFQPNKDQTVLVCSCEQSGDLPFCDGSHNRLHNKTRQQLASEFFSEPIRALQKLFGFRAS